MKKGIVMEQHRNYSIVMAKDGTFHKAKPIPSSLPGDEVQYELLEEKENKWKTVLFPSKLKPSYRFVAMVAALLIAILPLYSWYDSNQAYAYVNIDMNPSIEMKVNKKMKVIELIPLNDDASLLVEKITDWKNKSVEKVTVTVIQKGQETGLLNSDTVMIGVSYDRGSKKDKQITHVIDEYLQSKPVNLMVATFEVPKEIRDQAQKEKKSMNELLAKTYESTNVSAKVSSLSKLQLNEQEKEALKAFYNKTNNAPDKEKKVEQPDKEEKEKDNLKPQKEKEKSDKPIGNKKDTDKNKKKPKKEKEKEDDDDIESDDLESQLEDAEEELEEILETLPPGIKQKLKNAGIDDIEDVLESLPPGVLKQLEKADNLEELEEILELNNVSILRSILGGQDERDDKDHHDKKEKKKKSKKDHDDDREKERDDDEDEDEDDEEDEDRDDQEDIINEFVNELTGDKED